MRWRALGEWLSTHTTIVLAGILVVTLALAPGLTMLEFETGQDSFLNSDSDIAIDNEDYQDLFGGETMVVLFTADEGKTIADFFTPANLEELERIEDELRASDVVQGVVSPVTAMTWTQNLVTSGVATGVLQRAIEREPDEAAKQLRADNITVTAIRSTTASAEGGEDIANPDWAKFLLFENTGYTLDGAEVTPPPDDQLEIRRALRGFVPNTTNALMGVVLVGNAPLDQLSEGEDLVKEVLEGADFENVSVTITGTPTFLSDINDYLRGGMLTLGGIALLIMAGVLLLIFRVRWRLLPLAIVLVGVAWAFSILGYMGLGLSLVTISGLPILIGMGVDFAIQVHNRVEEEIIAEEDHGDPFGETAQKLGPALLTATIAAAVSFLTMEISKVPMIRDFGILLAVGIVVLFVIGFTAPLAVLGARERRRATSGTTEFGWLANGVVWLGSLPRQAAYPAIALAIFIPIIGVSLESNFEIESDPINWANPETETIKNARFFEDETGFATTLGIFIETEGEDENGIYTDEMAAFVHDFTLNEVDDQPILAEASSLTTTLSYLIAVDGATAIPPTGVDMLLAYEEAPPDIQALLVAENGNAAQINVRVAPSGLDERSDVFTELDESIAQPPDDRSLIPDNATATPSGLATVGVGLLDNITANRAALTYLALAAVALWLVIRFRSATKMFLSLVPVLIAVGLTSIVISILDITLSPLTTVSGPLVIATCSEFTILILFRYLEERDRGHEARHAADVASIFTGRAFVASALTTVGGFGVLIFSALPLLSDFGAIVTLNIVIALLSALIVLPPILVWADDKGLLGLTASGTAKEDAQTTTWAVAGVVGVALAVACVALIVSASGDDDDDLALETVAAAAPATFPPPTTAPPQTTADPNATTLPPGDPERPDGTVAPLVWDAYVDAGADPGVARCLTDYLFAELTTEDELLALGIAARAPAATDLVAEAAVACGVPPDVSETVANS
ncbi:MAG: MMPL family transporter [Acidimicrobiia bacterium]|nr:MMPL family transporter [Acidimicrobiia bacterium]